MPKVHAEIEYIHPTEGHSVHSDICPPGCDSENLSDPKWRGFLHDCLDEWLNKSKGMGIFYIKNEDAKIDF